MNITLIYFSQTGNTRKISNAMAQTFTNAGHNVTNRDMRKMKAEDLLSSDLIGIGSPTFEAHAPTPVKEFIKSLTQLENKRAFVFATGCGAAGNVLSDLTKLLKKRGANVIGDFFSLGEISHPAPCLIGKTPNRPNKEDLNSATNFALTISEHLNNKKINRKDLKAKIKKGFYNIVGSIAGSDWVIQTLVPKPKNIKEKCKQCNLCVKECPIDNIKLNPYPILNNKCIRCYRCLNVCPSKAFNVNWTLGNIIISALWNETFLKKFGEYE